MKSRKCPTCRSEMRGSLVSHNYRECGLEFVTLENVPVYDCQRCGEHVLSIPAIEQLHRGIALALAHKPFRLMPQEVKFIRRYLGLSNVDFARTMGVSREQASRWTSTDPMGASAERLLRLLVERIEPAEKYPIDWLQNISEERDRVEPIRLRSSDARWEQVGNDAPAA